MSRQPVYVYVAAEKPVNSIAFRYRRLLNVAGWELALTWSPNRRRWWRR